MAARAEAADSSMPARVQSLTVELRQYYLQPLSSGRGLFQGWNRDGRGGNATRGATDVVLEDAAGAGSTSEEWMDRIERRLDQEGLGLRSASLRRKPTLIDRGIDAVFMPEPIKLGRTQLAFSPYTAIKRRNPLCLLNPIPLAVSW